MTDMGDGEPAPSAGRRRRRAQMSSPGAPAPNPDVVPRRPLPAGPTSGPGEDSPAAGPAPSAPARSRPAGAAADPEVRRLVVAELVGSYAQLAQRNDAMNQQAGVVIAFAGALVALHHEGSGLLGNIGLVITGLAGIVAIAAFFPLTLPSFQAGAFAEGYLDKELEEVTRVYVRAYRTILATFALRLVDKRNRLLGALFLLVAGAGLTGLGLVVSRPSPSPVTVVPTTSPTPPSRPSAALRPGGTLRAPSTTAPREGGP